ncbi:MAG: amidohydrolase family protein [Planctomycetaceae bacterium]
MITDVNVYLSRWPFRRLPYDETPALVEKLRQSDITQAWAGSFDGLLHKDVAQVNSRLVDECKKHGDGLLRPVGTVNPTLPDWQDDLRRCHDEYKMQAIRLHPNYHGYTLDDPRFAELLTLAEAAGLIVQLALYMEDPRTHHKLLPIQHVQPGPLKELMSARPQLKMILLNTGTSIAGAPLAELVRAGNVYIDTSHAESIVGLEKLVRLVPPERILFGSHFPFFILEANLFKFQESELGTTVTEAIQSQNAQMLIGE